MATILSQAAAGKKLKTKSEKDYQQTQASINLRTMFRKIYDVCLLFPESVSLEKIYKQWPNDWSLEDWNTILKQALDKVFGDPLMLTNQQLNLRQYTIPYYNPTGHRINVAPLGLPDEEGKLIFYIAPGGMIGIPQGYLVGGTRSTVAGVAPQLRAMPKAEVDSSLDINPNSYVEWITYKPFKLSSCCKRQVVWSDAKQHLLCDKCKEEISLV